MYMISQIKDFLDKENSDRKLYPYCLKDMLQYKSKILINEPKYFFPFMLFTIFGVLVYYSNTVDEILPAIVLAALWVLFWNNSTDKGKTILIVASVLGYIHELLGVKYGYFTYLGGSIGGSPVWLIPGYGTIFWSSYNLWKTFENKYENKQWFRFSNGFVIASMTALIAIDYMLFDLSTNTAGIMIKITLAFMLFRSFGGLRLAYFVAFFTVLTEFTGEVLGTWYHPNFSLLSLMAGYVFLLWVCLTINDIVKGKSYMILRESASAAALTTFYILSMLGLIVV